ncbi:nitrilotriacetate monooxygenase component A IIA synthase subunit A [Coleophoma crateriformis]|uniref:Nitrilotriacetate monooxygenase component A IIA synthase subunit A n=1 Tax=Coleophoma crateriformis TaxID=565419 RepID=A0A3D8QQ26_9HELO|nr:nitrilotriacetate monooxygenase component A IIA synthase subunit A [Coleophoma crateriformis]
MSSPEGAPVELRPTQKRQMHLNFFETACNGSHMCTGQWKDPNDNSRYKDRLEYYIWLAKLADKGKITSIFFADGYGLMSTYQGKPDATFRGGSMVAYLDPVVLISAMAAVTKSVAFGITGSTSYINPFILARTWSTLDHVTRGRIAWNVVTSYSNSAAQAMGFDKVRPSEERYKAAHEYMDLVYQLWEKSWEDGAVAWQAEPEMAYDPEKIHKIDFDGEFHRCHAYHQTHPSPQRTPVIFQAGASKSGIDFAGKHGEAIYTDNMTFDSLTSYVKDVRAAAVKYGRDPYDVKIFVAIMPFLGRTLEEAQEKYRKAEALVSVQSGLAKLCGFTGLDLSKYPYKEPFTFEAQAGDGAITGVIKNFNLRVKESTEPLTPEKIGKLAGFINTPAPIGTPEMVADVFQEWMDKTDVDGFNLVYVSNPMSYEDIVELLVPELQKRKLMWSDYTVPGGTYRENLHNTPGDSFLNARHPGSKYKWNKQTEGTDAKAETNGTTVNPEIVVPVMSESVPAMQAQAQEVAA